MCEMVGRETKVSYEMRRENEPKRRRRRRKKRKETGHLQLMLRSARGFQKNTQSSFRYAHVRTHSIVLACSPQRHTHKHTSTQVGLRSLVCQFVVPLVPSQEALRQASSHAWTGTGPAKTLTHARTQTHTHTHPHLHSHCIIAAGTAISGLSVWVCVCE